MYGSLLGIITWPIDKAINWVMGLFGWGDPDEPFNLLETILAPIKGAIGWVKTLFTDPVAALKTLWTNVLGNFDSLIGILMWPIDKAINWVMGLFGWSTPDGEPFSLWGAIKNGLTAVWDWITGLFDIDWVQAIKALVPDWIMDVPIIGKWFGGGDVSSESVGEEIKEHGQTLKAAKKSGLYNKDSFGASEINREALAQGVQSGAVQKEMLQAIIDDEDLRDEDLQFMQTLVKQATEEGSLYVHDIELGKLITEGNVDSRDVANRLQVVEEAQTQPIAPVVISDSSNKSTVSNQTVVTTSTLSVDSQDMVAAKLNFVLPGISYSH
jgi:hypothetical protein